MMKMMVVLMVVVVTEAGRHGEWRLKRREKVLSAPDA